MKSYKARENDELALEKADIVMVLRQSTDGKQVCYEVAVRGGGKRQKLRAENDNLNGDCP